MGIQPSERMCTRMSGTLPVITISRQSGSRGREAGKELAKELGIPYYDYAILDQAAKESGLDPALFERAESSAASMLERLKKGLPATDMTINAKIFGAQSKIIQSLAAKGPAVIVGRCADSVLQDHPNVVNIYIYASEARRIQNVMEKKGISERMASVFVRSVDKGRRAYHNFFSSHPWGDMASYDLCICTDDLTPKETAQTILSFLSNRHKN